MSAITVRRVAGALATVLGVLLVAVFVVQAAPGVVGADASYVVLSGSMEPTISPGDAVVVRDVDPATLESGDVITFVRSDESTPVTHRVVEVVEGEDGLAFRTKGDANSDPDPAPVPASNVTGEVWFAIPLVGHVVMFANTPTGLAVLVGLPIAAFVVSELYAFVRDDDVVSEQGANAGRDDGAPAGRDVDAPAVGELGEPAATEMDWVDEPAASETTGDAGDDAFTVTTRDLQLSTVGFGSLAAYSGYVAYQNPNPVSVGVFAGAALVVAFVAAVFVAGRNASSDEGSDDRRPKNQQVADGGDVTDGGEGREE